jgi:hypothetical protein
MWVCVCVCVCFDVHKLSAVMFDGHVRAVRKWSVRRTTCKKRETENGQNWETNIKEKLTCTFCKINSIQIKSVWKLQINCKMILCILGRPTGSNHLSLAPLQRLVAAGRLPLAPLLLAAAPLSAARARSCRPSTARRHLLFLPCASTSHRHWSRSTTSPAAARSAAPRPPPSSPMSSRKRPGAPRAHQPAQATRSSLYCRFSRLPVPYSAAAPFCGAPRAGHFCPNKSCLNLPPARAKPQDHRKQAAGRRSPSPPTTSTAESPPSSPIPFRWAPGTPPPQNEVAAPPPCSRCSRLAGSPPTRHGGISFFYLRWFSLNPRNQCKIQKFIKYCINFIKIQTKFSYNPHEHLYEILTLLSILHYFFVWKIVKLNLV